LLRGETNPRAYFNEIHVQALTSSTIFAKALASKIFKVYSPALFARRVGREVMLGARRPGAEASDVSLDLNGQSVYMMGIPRIILVYSAAFGKSRQRTASKKAESEP
jgi:hypothetical protein